MRFEDYHKRIKEAEGEYNRGITQLRTVFEQAKKAIVEEAKRELAPTNTGLWYKWVRYDGGPVSFGAIRHGAVQSFDLTGETTHRHEGPLRLCKSGFHATQVPFSFNCGVAPGISNRLFLVEVSKERVDSAFKSCFRTIRFVIELDRESEEYQRLQDYARIRNL